MKFNEIDAYNWHGEWMMGRLEEMLKKVWSELTHPKHLNLVLSVSSRFIKEYRNKYPEDKSGFKMNGLDRSYYKEG